MELVELPGSNVCCGFGGAFSVKMSELSEDALRVLELNYPDHPGIQEVAELDID